MLDKWRCQVDNRQNNNPENDNNNNKKKPASTFLIVLIISIVFFLIYYYAATAITNHRNKSISYNELQKMVDEGKVDHVESDYENNRFVIYSTSYDDDGRLYYVGFDVDPEMRKYFTEKGVEYYGIDKKSTSPIITFLVEWVLPFGLIFGLMFFMYRNLFKSGGIGGVGKSRAKMYVEKDIGVTFKDVAGQEEAKDSVVELVDFLHDPEKYTRIGAKLPKGALLVGPPGTGKTLLAKAVAGEAHVPFFALSGSDFVEMFVGVGASRVRDLFKEATQQAPCIIFIDEIDAIGKSRDSRYGGGNDEREQTLNQLLSEMDGFDPSKGIVVLAATNRPEILDKALLRPGRFDRRIIVDKPDLKGRLQTLKVHSKNVLMHENVDLEAIAKATSGAVGADLANMINEAAILAVKSGRTVVRQEDLMEAVEVVIAGKEKKDRILGPEEKKIVAVHEVGHALVAALQKHSEPVQKITIVPRTKGALGYTMQVPEEEKYLSSKDEILDEIRVFCGGRAAEEIKIGSITTGAANDIERATAHARQMITRFGMSEEFGLVALESVQGQYLENRLVLQCSDSYAAKIDDAVKNIMEKCYNEAKELITGNLDVLDAVAAYLIEKETITGEEFMKIMDETIEKRNLPDYGSLMPTETPDTNNSIITVINLGDENN
ncbi:MAG: ATP-dependent zinc metalloprotease FtsH [Lachnospiraceae bacterium]|nr:ATP-dependent zinc metalloprotease FtsH [Lachnospiraceae bacterium]